MATIEQIKRVTIIGTTQGMPEAQAALGKVADAQDKVAASGTTVAKVTDTVTRQQLSAVNAFQRLQRQIDDNARAEQDLARGLAIVQKAVQQGTVSVEEAAAAEALLRDRHTQALKAVNDNTAGIKAHGEASGNSTVASAMFGSAIHRTVDSLASGLPITTIAIQQGTELVSAFGMAGGVAGAMTALLSPTTLMIVGFTAAVGVFHLLTNASHDAEAALKAHEDIIGRIKALYGEAAQGIEAYGQESRKVVQFLAAADLKAQVDNLKAQAEALTKLLTVVVTPGKSAGSYTAVAGEYRDFASAIEALRQSAAAGRPDIKAFQEAVIDRTRIDPTNEALQALGKKLIDVSDSGAKAQRALFGSSSAIDTIGASAATNAARVDAFNKALDKLASFAAPELSKSEQIDQTYRQAMASASDRADRAAAQAQRQAAFDQLSASVVPLPPKKPNYLSANPDGSYGSAASYNKAQSADARSENSWTKSTEEMQKQIDLLGQQASLFGASAAAQERARVVTELMTKAQEANRLAGMKDTAATPAQIQKINELADAAAKATQALEDLQNRQEAINYLKDLTKGLVSDFETNLKNGESVWEAFGNAAESALQKIADKLIEMAIDNLFANAFGGQSSSGGLLSGLTKLLGFSSGGYTGDIGANQPAGVVHGQEFVVNAAATSQHRGLLEAINSGTPGYATGGYVTPIAAPRAANNNGGSQAVTIHQTISNDFRGADAATIARAQSVVSSQIVEAAKQGTIQALRDGLRRNPRFLAS